MFLAEEVLGVVLAEEVRVVILAEEVLGVVLAEEVLVKSSLKRFAWYSLAVQVC